MAFSGRAIYDNNVFDGVAEDVSDMISMISPRETPFLDRIGDAEQPGDNVLHEWLEDKLNPTTLVSSTDASSTTAATSIKIHNGGTDEAPYIQTGAVLKVKDTGEYVQVTGVTGSDVTISRAFGDTTATSFGAGAELFMISDAALEGADVDGDISRPRTRLNNYMQIFKKDLIISGTVQAINNIGVGDEFDYQRVQRLREIVRDLEKAVIQGKLSGNSLGSSTAYRTMKGVWDFISTNVSTTATGSLTPSFVNSVIQGAWDSGGTDLDLIVADPNWKKEIDTWNDTRIEVMNSDTTFRQRVSLFDSTFGTIPVILDRWMPTDSLMVVSTERVKVIPLRGRSFQFQEVSRTGDARKGYVLGEYTVEVRNEEGMAKAYA